ncbi:MAG TPA: peptidase [Coleofasciculaceae cyanobacterium]
MNRAFRKYHRVLALIVSLPLILTVITGLGYTILDEWFENERVAETLLQLHTMEILGLGRVYPIINALGLAAMIITGLSMTSLFRKRPQSSTGSDRHS